MKMNEAEWSYGCDDKLEDELAELVAQLIVQNGTYNPFVLYGCGDDKQMRILDAIVRCARRENKNANIIWQTCEDFINDLINAVQTESISTFRKHYREADWLILTRLEYVSGRETTQEELYFLLDDRLQRNRQTVISCDIAPGEILGIEDRIVAQLYGGVVTSL